jgi:amidase
MTNFDDRRGFMAKSLQASALAAAGSGAAASGLGASINVARPGLLSASVPQLQKAMAAGSLSAETLTRMYLKRIEEVDRRGPKINAVIELNPDAVVIARTLDAERRAGKLRGLLHGIPVLLKDNIATGDRMSTTAGSLALDGLHAKRDAFIVTRLREAGAVILGKTNLSEWANFRSTRSTSGWSSRGGQTLNPHVLARNTSGSSAGSAAAAAASLCALTVGTETDGSIISPANNCGIVGLKPTLGLVSRDGIIPIAASQDTAGPMTRSVTDCALLLTVLAGQDARDAATAQSAGRAPADYLAALDVQGLKGARLGVIRSGLPPQPEVMALFERALVQLRGQGAVLIDDLKIPSVDRYGDTETLALLNEFKPGLAAYLAEFQPDAPVKTLADLIAWNQAHAAQTMADFGQELLEQSQASAGLDSAAYLEALAANQRYSRAEGLDVLFAEHRLDAIITPAGNVAWLTDPIVGDHFTAGGMTSPFAVAGYPHITVPMGHVRGLPVGLSIGGLAWSEASLLKYAYAFERVSQARRDPAYRLR